MSFVHCIKMSLPWRLLPTGRQTVVWAACATLLKHYGRGNDCEQKAICFASCHVCQPFPAISQVGSGVVHTVCANTHIQTNGYEKKKKSPDLKLPDVSGYSVFGASRCLIFRLTSSHLFTHYILICSHRQLTSA